VAYIKIRYRLPVVVNATADELCSRWRQTDATASTRR